MKTLRTFNGSWFLFAIVVTIFVGEVVAWELSNQFGFRHNPFLAAFICLGLVAAMAFVLTTEGTSSEAKLNLP